MNLKTVGAILILVICAYIFVEEKDVSHPVDPFVLSALAIYFVDAVLVVLMTTEDARRPALFYFFCFMCKVSCLHLLLVSLCLFMGIEQKYAVMNVVPPAIDIFMRAFDSSWELLTSTTQVVSLCLMFYFSYHPARIVLRAATIAFVVSVWGSQAEQRRTVVFFANAVGIFGVVWTLWGKDLEDLSVEANSWINHLQSEATYENILLQFPSTYLTNIFT